MFTLQFDLADFRKRAHQMGIFADDQLPYAISRSLNETMKQDVRTQIIGQTWQRAFKVRNSGLPRASILTEFSSKGQRPWSAGLYDALHKAHLAVHAEGGARPREGSTLAIPNQRGRVVLTARGRKPWARQVPRMVDKRALRVIKGKGIFVGEGGRLHAWYWFRGNAHLKKRFMFYEDFKRRTEASLPQKFSIYIQQAIATSFR